MIETGAMTWAAVLAVAAGGAVGAVVRHLLTLAPWGARHGVLIANTVGSSGLGALVAVVDSPVVLLLLGTGLCGALTTWSTLAVQTEELGRRSPGRAVAFVTLNVILGLGAALFTLVLLG